MNGARRYAVGDGCCDIIRSARSGCCRTMRWMNDSRSALVSCSAADLMSCSSGVGVAFISILLQFAGCLLIQDLEAGGSVRWAKLTLQECPKSLQLLDDFFCLIGRSRYLGRDEIKHAIPIKHLLVNVERHRSPPALIFSILSYLSRRRLRYQRE